MLLYGTRGVSGQGGIQEEINPNHADSYTDNFQSQESICKCYYKCYHTNILGYGEDLIMQNLTFSHHWFKESTVCASDSLF